MDENRVNRTKAVAVKFLMIFLLLGISLILFSLAPYYKPTETFKKGVMHLVVDDKDVTNYLPDPVYVEDDVIMMSAETAMKYFNNIYVYYDEKYDTTIITSEMQVGKIKTGEKKINVNGEDKEIDGTTKFVDGKLYIPASSIQDVIEVELWYNEKVVATTLWGWSRAKVVKVDGNHKLKAYKREISLTNGVVKDGENMYIFDTEGKVSGDYLVVRNERGDIGYCKFGNIRVSDIVRFNQGTRVLKYKDLYDDLKYSFAWEYATYNTPDRSAQKKIDALRVISPSWIEVKNSDAELSTNIDRNYIDWAKEEKYRLWPTLKNDFIEMNDLSIIMNDMQLREKLINNVLKIALEYKFDGINLDFEYMKKEDKGVFSEFVRELSSTLRANELIASVDVTVAGGSDTYSLCYDRTAIAKAADYIMLMAYDQYGDWSKKPGSCASLSWVKDNIEEMLGYENVSKDKLFLCVPFYFNKWIVDSSTGEKIKYETIFMSQADRYLNTYRSKAQWSEKDGQYYIENDLGNGTTEMIWLENEDSIKKKVELINDYDLAGIAAWRLGYEDGSNVWKTIGETMNER